MKRCIICAKEGALLAVPDWYCHPPLIAADRVCPSCHALIEARAFDILNRLSASKPNAERATPWQSQAGQDQWVAAVFGLPGLHGTFLDIGAGDPVIRNNSFALERAFGWTGLCVERDPAMAARAIAAGRACKWWTADALAINWSGVFQTVFADRRITYLSLDCDEASTLILGNIRAAGLLDRFGVLTVEHDAYRFGGEPRRQQRLWLQDAGYLLVASDVRDQGLPFEDWWVHADHFPAAAKFLSLDRDWKYILSLR